MPRKKVKKMPEPSSKQYDKRYEREYLEAQHAYLLTCIRERVRPVILSLEIETGEGEKQKLVAPGIAVWRKAGIALDRQLNPKLKKRLILELELQEIEPKNAKGVLGGVCADPGCDKFYAHWYDLMTGRFYCQVCAGFLNRRTRASDPRAIQYKEYLSRKTH